MREGTRDRLLKLREIDSWREEAGVGVDAIGNGGASVRVENGFILFFLCFLSILNTGL